MWTLDNRDGRHLTRLDLRVALSPVKHRRDVPSFLQSLALLDDGGPASATITSVWIWPSVTTDERFCAMLSLLYRTLVTSAEQMAPQYLRLTRTTYFSCSFCGGELVAPLRPRAGPYASARVRERRAQFTILVFPVCRDLACFTKGARLGAALNRTPPIPGVLLSVRRRRCTACRVLEKPPVTQKFRICSGCWTAYYCSETCQETAWPQHRVLCREIAKVIDAEEEETAEEVETKPL